MNDISLPLKKIIKSNVFLSNWMRIYSRKKRANSYFKETKRQIRDWSRKSTEFSNYYYDLKPSNEKYLISLLSTITNTKYSIVENYIQELHNNKNLHSIISKFWADDASMKDAQISFGRRIGWYALIRINKPKLVIETGVHHGIGACIIAVALEENIKEGFPGKYLGTDINKNAGKLFNSNFSHIGKVLYGDSIESLKEISEKIDLFINDSDHSDEYEYREYSVIKNKLSPHAVILGDNSHVTESLHKFSIKNNRHFVFFKEDPLNHWYPGGGIGISIPSANHQV